MEGIFDNEPSPEFNSSIEYLKRISQLLWSIHIARQETESCEDDFLLLESLDIELDPRMNVDERNQSELLRGRCVNGKNKQMIRDWFVFLNRLAHDKKLIMKNSDQMAGVIRG